jgi:hypothetical protein
MGHNAQRLPVSELYHYNDLDLVTGVRVKFTLTSLSEPFMKIISKKYVSERSHLRTLKNSSLTVTVILSLKPRLRLCLHK